MLFVYRYVTNFPSHMWVWKEKFGGKSYLIIADGSSGYLWCENMGKHITSKEVSNNFCLLFFKLGIPLQHQLRMGLEFRGPFRKLLEELKIPYKPSSPFFNFLKYVTEKYYYKNKYYCKQKSWKSPTVF